MEAQFEELIESFITGKVGQSGTFINQQLSAALVQNIMAHKERGVLKTAGIGSATQHTHATSIRSDKTLWLKEDTDNDAEKEFLDIIARFIAYLNRTCYTGINACEFHYTLYEPGAFYARHKDQFRNNNSRKFSMINYLNDNWMAADGGQLIIYHDDRDAQHILPENGKTVFFQSDALDHEVAVAHRPRMSITGWLKKV